jgi:hypothetical protein
MALVGLERGGDVPAGVVRITLARFDMMAAEAFASDDLGEGVGALRERPAPRFKGS